MSAQLNAAIAASNIVEAATLAFAQAGLGQLPITQLIGIAELLAGRGKPEQAIALYQLWIQHGDAPLMHAAWYNLAVLQMQGGAERSYRRALEIQVNFTEAYLGLGALMERRREPERELDIWDQALDLLDPAGANAARLQIQLFNHIGRVADQRGRYPQAEEALASSLRLDPRQPRVADRWIRLRQRQCAWPVLAPLPGLDEEQLLAAAAALSDRAATTTANCASAIWRRTPGPKAPHCTRCTTASWSRSTASAGVRRTTRPPACAWRRGWTTICASTASTTCGRRS